MKRYTAETIPASAAYLGSTEGPGMMSEFLADLLADAIAPAWNPPHAPRLLPLVEVRCLVHGGQCTPSRRTKAASR
jgi:hypothetical protein